ncbi:claudin-10 [Triplophysa rosa]|uniref:Claudin-10 n=1 Tax=Triplophysa rosa TaxID=992332 RepID=A0A9W7WSD6_TRIRA|nr:claudin-10 [Triplophysa rosa]KAI7807393.1 putative claudin-10 [Triplophysa rosa]
MKVRGMQIWGLLLTLLGWIFVACTMAMESWKVTSVGGQGGSSIITVGWYWSSLWRACYTDSAATSNCYDFPVLWAVEDYLQIVRALLMSGMGVGVLGFILSFAGMECTYIGGKDHEKNRSMFTGSFCHVLSGLLSACGYAVYAHYVSAEFFNPRFDGLQFDLGTPLFLGWAGCAFQITGGIFFLVSVYKIRSQTYSRPLTSIVPAVEGKASRSSHTNLSIISELSSKSGVSSISELSSQSHISPVNTRVSRTRRTSRRKSRSSVKSAVYRPVRSSMSSRLSRSDLNRRKLSAPSRTATHFFIRNSYL